MNMRVEEQQLSIAVAALKRIKRTLVNKHCPHGVDDDSCRCPKCEARNALKEITELQMTGELR